MDLFVLNIGKLTGYPNEPSDKQIFCSLGRCLSS